MTLLEAEVHRNNCLDVDPHEPPDAGDWLTQKVYEHETIAIDDEWDEGGSEGDSDVEFCEARSPPVAVAPPPQKSAFAVLMQGARDTAAAVAKTALAAASAIVSVGGPPASRRPCPFYKRIPGTPIVVDGFQYASKQLSAHYVLTHFHSDHYGGITKHFDAGIIYCSPITAALVVSNLGVNRRYVKAIPMCTPTVLEGLSVEVTLMDANHCPGAAIWLFRVFRDAPLLGSKPPDKYHLHVGDFRWNNKLMTSFPWLRAVSAGSSGAHRVDSLFLDTTYCKPCYVFPSQADTIAAVIEIVMLHLGQDAAENAKAQSSKLAFAPAPGPVARTLFLFGTYSVGKERLFMEVARTLNEPVYVSKSKYSMISKFEWPPELMGLLTSDPEKSRLHTVGMFGLSMKSLGTQLAKLRSDAAVPRSASVPVVPSRPAAAKATSVKKFSKSSSLTFFLKSGPDSSGHTVEPGPPPPPPPKPSYTSIVAFKPTGWTVDSGGAGGGGGSGAWAERRGPATTSIMTSVGVRVTCAQRPGVSLYGVPYSEHSSFPELQDCVRFVDPIRIIPTVNCRSAADSDAMIQLLRF